jgi:TolB protein
MRILPLLLVALACRAQSNRADAVLKEWFDTIPVIAVPDMRGSGDAQGHMAAFNATLFADLQQSGWFRMASKSFYPAEIPQQPSDFKPPRGNPPQRQGPWFTDWTAPSVQARYLTVGYTAVQNNRLVLFGWLFDVSQADVQAAQIHNKLYFGDVDEAGARKVAHEFAADILKKFGATSLYGTKVYFTSNRSGAKEIWSMDFDGGGQKQVTREGFLSNFSAVSPDGTRLAYTSFPRGNASILMMSLETGRKLPFYNQRASTNASPEFTPDGQRLLFASTLAGIQQIYACNLDGSGMKRVSFSQAVDTEPKVNPKTGSEIIFTSGRSGPPQIYKMNMDGADVVRLTSGEGEAVNPAWHPDGQLMAFSWTGGPDPGMRNLFVMDVATRTFVQITHGSGRNENPAWSPDGRHLVFQTTRSGRNQIWSMLANGTELRQLTTQGANEEPVWSRN